MDLGSVLVTQCALTSCHVVISEQGGEVRQGGPVEQVCNRKETTWYESHAVRFRLSLQSESRVEPGIRSRSEASERSLMICLARGTSVRTLWLQEKGMGQEVYSSLTMSLHLSLNLTTNCWPLLIIKWKRHNFIKKCVLFR